MSLKKLRKKIANNPRLNHFVEGLFARYVRFAFRTSRFERTGCEDMDACVALGEPVIFVVWHQRLIMAPFMFNAPPGARICALTSAARAGRLAGQILVNLGWETIPMSSHQRHITLSREVLKRIKQGCSIGIAADGPRGPARVSSTVPIVWARTSGARVFTVAFAQKRVFRFPTWDKQMLPMPFSRGVITCQEWTDAVPRKPSEEQVEELRLSLQSALDHITDAADAALGKPHENPNTRA
ncbi:lysophospholipid acyltransferase family protein [Shimia sp.]|uniref:lysophospholipid acyltransferase family protein n=1 Tax=Shimia sp. TaxID=1954381 RepID=UPI003BAC3736